MAENEERNRHTPIFSIEPKPIDEKTLADVIKNAEQGLLTGSISGLSIAIHNGIYPGHITGPSKYVEYKEVIRHEWVVPNEKIRKAIEEGNKENYIFMTCTIQQHPAKLVLCEVSKDVYNDRTFKINYNTLTAETIKRMPE